MTQNGKSKALFALLLTLMLLAASSFEIICAKTEPRESEVRPIATFPASLQILDDEAFSGTTIEVAIFGDALQSVGERAFHDVQSLTDVYLPESTESIGIHSFPVGVLIHGVEGSYAQTWAEENGFIFTTINIHNDAVEVKSIDFEGLLLLLCVAIPTDIQIMEKIRRYYLYFAKSLRPQDRPELYPINYRFP